MRSGVMAQIAIKYGGLFLSKYEHVICYQQLKALRDIIKCRTAACGELIVGCPKCGKIEYKAHSCGNRSCPQCQNHEANVWLERQKAKLLPVRYYMATFTIPSQLRNLAQWNQVKFFNCMFWASKEALKEFGKHPKFLGGEIGMTGVLQTNSRRQEFHPHIHYIIPGGAYNATQNLWIRKRWRYLFPQNKVAETFKRNLLLALANCGLVVPSAVLTMDWNVDIRGVGYGESALKYLSSYLYRGAISEKAITHHESTGKVSFRYKESKSGETKCRTMPGEDFLWLFLQHVLPKGFRRVRDFGLLHGIKRNALRFIQFLLSVKTKKPAEPTKPAFKCPRCKTPMRVLAVQIRPRGKRKRAPPIKKKNHTQTAI